MGTGKDGCVSVKLIGAVCVIVGCGGIGFQMAHDRLRTEKYIRMLIAALDHILLELQYRCLPLPDLSRGAANVSYGIVRKLFMLFAEELENQISPDAECCARAAIGRMGKIPPTIADLFQKMGRLLGNYDLCGQIESLRSVHQECNKVLEDLVNNKENRIRGYQTLGLCTGAAVVILLI